MDVAKDEEAGDGKEDEVDGEKDEGKENRRTPVKLHGRGGFTHPRGTGRGRGYGRGRGRGAGSGTQMSDPPATNGAPAQSALDPMEGLTSRMSALQFVPHSLYARSKGLARGG